MADEQSDIAECVSAFLAATGESIEQSEAIWEPRIFGPNRVEFSDPRVSCEVGFRGIVNLTQGSTIYFYDGWPVGRQSLFNEFEKTIETEKAILTAKLKELDEVVNDAEQALRRYSTNEEDALENLRLRVASILDSEQEISPRQDKDPLAALQRRLESCNSLVESQQSSLLSCQEQIERTSASSETTNEPNEAFERLVEAVGKGQFDVANAMLEDDAIISNLTPDQVDDLEKLTISIVRPIPSHNSRDNRDGYLLLSRLRPGNETYAARLLSYNEQLEQDEFDVDRQVCRALVIYLGSTPERGTLSIASARGLPNEGIWRRVFIVTYRRGVDNTVWRYACGIEDQKINWSMISDSGNLGRRWRESDAMPRVTYRVDGNVVTFRQYFEDGSIDEETLQLSE